MNRNLFSLLLAALVTALLSGCKKWVSVAPPPESPSSQALFSSEASARGVLSGVYSEMMSGQHFASSLTTLYGGLAADELYYYTPGLRDAFTRNELDAATHPLLSSGLWQPAYRFIYIANLVLEKLPAAPLDPTVKRVLMGEARFVRAFCYGHLAAFFGGVPLVAATDYRATQGLARSTPEALYAFILEDLLFAEKALPPIPHPPDRLRPSQEAALALRAQVHLYRGQWRQAAEAATAVIGPGHIRLATSPEEVFRPGSPETIFFLPAPPPHYRLPEAAAVLPMSPSALPTYCLRPELLQAFGAGDRRRGAWIATRTFAGTPLHYPAKYKDPSTLADSGAYTVLRLGELYLVRAEALAHLDDLSGARADLNAIRLRAGLPPLPQLSKEQLLLAIEAERRLELAFEWGHRWNDLRRTGRADGILGVLKGADWQATDSLWPLPGDQLLLNPALTQNPGY